MANINDYSRIADVEDIMSLAPNDRIKPRVPKNKSPYYMHEGAYRHVRLPLDIENQIYRIYADFRVKDELSVMFKALKAPTSVKRFLWQPIYAQMRDCEHTGRFAGINPCAIFMDSFKKYLDKKGDPDNLEWIDIIPDQVNMSTGLWSATDKDVIKAPFVGPKKKDKTTPENYQINYIRDQPVNYPSKINTKIPMILTSMIGTHADGVKGCRGEGVSFDLHNEGAGSVIAHLSKKRKTGRGLTKKESEAWIKAYMTINEETRRDNGAVLQKNARCSE